MEKPEALQKLLNGIASDEDIQLLKQMLASGEISIGGNVNQSVIIVGSGNTVQLTQQALEALNGRSLLGDLERDLTSSEIDFGLGRLEELIPERAPVLKNKIDTLNRRLRATLYTDPNALSNESRAERTEMLARLNRLCMEVTDIAFNALCTGIEPPVYNSRSPFRGLETFRPEDAAYFFGREALTRKLVQKLNEHDFLAILGASGSGKSSLVMAGLIPALNVPYAIFRPGVDPLSEVEKALQQFPSPSGRGGGSEGLLVVDQFEELFTLSAWEQRPEFISRLLEQSGRLWVVITLRADFLGEVALFKSLKDEVENHQVIIPPMDEAELRRAMEGQAACAGLRFESDLSQQMLDDVSGEPGAMPLLQHALWTLWTRRHGRWLRAEEYRAFGGVKQAIASTAEAVYARCTDFEKVRLRDIFLRLTRLDESADGRDTCRRVLLRDLIPADSDPTSTTLLIKGLADARLVVVTGDEVEVAHEALIRHWERLRAWLNDDRDNLRLREGISEDARRWENANRDESLLNHRGPRLELALAMSKNPRCRLNPAEEAYLDECVGLREREKAAAAKRRQYAITGVSAALVVIMAILVGWGITNKQQVEIAQTAQAEAEEQAQISLSRQLSAQALNHMDDRFDLALLLSVEAFGRANTLESHDSLLTALQRQPYLLKFVYSISPVGEVTFSPDDKYLVTRSGKEISIWEIPGGTPVPISKLVVNGKEIVTCDGKVGYSTVYDSIRLWDIEKKRPLDFLTIPEYPVISQDGKMVATDETIQGRAKIVIRDTSTGSMIGILDDLNLLWPSDLIFSPDGTRLAASSMQDGERQPGILVWNFENPPLDEDGIFRLEEDWAEFIPENNYSEITDIVFSPDSKYIAYMTESPDNSITAEGFGVLSGQKGFVTSMSYSPGYPWNFASGGSDGTITLWNNNTYGDNIDDVLVGNGEAVRALSFSPSGKFMVNIGNSGFALWNMSAPPPLLIGSEIDSEISTIAPFINSVSETISYVSGGTSAISADGLWTARSVCFDVGREYGLEADMPCSRSTIQLTGQNVSYTLPGFYGMVTTLAFTPDGKILAAGICNEFDQNDCYSSEVLLWGTTTGQSIGEAFNNHEDAISRIAFNSDNTLLASGDRSGNVSLWNLDPVFWMEKACNMAGRNFTYAEWKLYFPTESYPSSQKEATCPQWSIEPKPTTTPMP